MKNKTIIMVLVFILGLIYPNVALAETEDEYPLWVGGVQVTKDNKSDVLKEADEGATVIFDSDTNTLTLNNAKIADGIKFDKDVLETARAAIYSSMDLNIVLIGNNVLGEKDEIKYSPINNYNIDGYSINYGIWNNGYNIKFIESDGTGSLEIIDYSDGIKAADVTFENDFGKLKINDYGKLPMQDLPPCAISASGDVVINGGILELKSEKENGITANKITINNGFIKILTNSEKNALYSYDGIIIDDDMEVLNAEYINGSTTELLASDSEIDEGFVTIRKAEFLVTFNSNGGSTVESQNISFGNKSTRPENPTKDLYAFDGWYTDEALTELFDFNTILSKNITLYAKWREVASFTYTIISGDNQELIIDNINSFILKIDGDYSLFESIKVGKLDLIKNEDYTVTENSTVITFTDSGISKLNTLSKGEHEILVKYSNSKEVKGKVLIKTEIDNPDTGDSYTKYYIIGIISLISIIGITLYTAKQSIK